MTKHSDTIAALFGVPTDDAAEQPESPFRKWLPSPQLAVLVGVGAVSRTEVTKRVWQYIVRQGLQDATARRMINCDKALAAVTKKQRVSVFELCKHIHQHLT